MAPLRCAAKFDPFLSLDCAPFPPPWRNPRKGRDQILPSGNTDLTFVEGDCGPAPLVEPVLQRRDEAVEQGRAERLHARLHGAVTDHHAVQAHADLAGRTCNQREEYWYEQEGNGTIDQRQQGI